MISRIINESGGVKLGRKKNPLSKKATIGVRLTPGIQAQLDALIHRHGPMRNHGAVVAMIVSRWIIDNSSDQMVDRLDELAAWTAVELPKYERAFAAAKELDEEKGQRASRQVKNDRAR